MKSEFRIKVACPVCGYQGTASDFRVKRNHKYASVYDSYEYVCPTCNEELSIKSASKQIVLSIIILAAVTLLFVFNKKLAMVFVLVIVGVLLVFIKSNSPLEFLKRRRPNE